MKIYFGTNLKMYKTVSETTQYLDSLIELTKDINRDQIELFVIPSYTSLPAASSCVDQQLIRLGSQNVCWEEEGQFTGEISPRMLKELGIDLIMAGHSERRHIFGETNQQENLKVKKVVGEGMTALLCIGETQAEKESGVSIEALRIQLKTGLKGIPASVLNKIRIAYEPVWSIGSSGVPASPEYAQAMHQEIKNCLFELYQQPALKIPVLYGGSVNLENAVPLIRQPDVDGLFIGRSAWDAFSFNRILRACL